MAASSPLDWLVVVYASHKEVGEDAIGRLSRHVERAYREGSQVAEGVVVLSTCNRFEVYLDSPSTLEPVEGIFRGEGVEPRVARGREAAVRLMRIASGLESAILGETEILAQVRQAMREAQARALLTGRLATLFRSALTAGRRARAETGISWGSAGYPGAAVMLAQRELGEVHTALVVGAGKAGRRLVEALCGSAGKILVASRSPERARSVASLCPGAEATSFDGLDGVEVDAVFVAVTGYKPPIGGVRARLVVDLSVPPVALDVASRVYTIEDLRGVVEDIVRRRARWIPAVERIIAEELETLEAKLLEARISRAVARILERRDALITSLAVDGDRRRLERLAGALLHPLLVSLRRAARRGAASFEEFLQILEEEYGGRP